MVAVLKHSNDTANYSNSNVAQYYLQQSSGTEAVWGLRDQVPRPGLDNLSEVLWVPSGTGLASHELGGPKGVWTVGYCWHPPAHNGIFTPSGNSTTAAAGAASAPATAELLLLRATATYMNLKVRNRNGTANRNRFLRNRLNRNAGFRNREPANQTAGSVPDHS